jgi:hypothetical protein
MPPHARHIAAATLALVLCQTGVDQGNATVIRNTQGNPGVETGGYHLPPKSWPAIPYSVIGAIQNETRSCVWSWRWFASFLHRRGDPRQPPGNGPLGIVPLGIAPLGIGPLGIVPLGNIPASLPPLP